MSVAGVSGAKIVALVSRVKSCHALACRRRANIDPSVGEALMKVVGPPLRGFRFAAALQTTSQNPQFSQEVGLSLLLWDVKVWG